MYTSASTIDTTTVRILKQIDRVFQRHGLRLNYSAGKTESVIQYKGTPPSPSPKKLYSLSVGRWLLIVATRDIQRFGRDGESLPGM